MRQRIKEKDQVRKIKTEKKREREKESMKERGTDVSKIGKLSN